MGLVASNLVVTNKQQQQVKKAKPVVNKVEENIEQPVGSVFGKYRTRLDGSHKDGKKSSFLNDMLSLDD